MLRAIVLALAIVCLGVSLGEGAEVVRVVPIQTIVDGIRPIFNEMMKDLQKAGCKSATGAAFTEGDRITLILKCTEWEKEADASQ